MNVYLNRLEKIKRDEREKYIKIFASMTTTWKDLFGYKEQTPYLPSHYEGKK